ncbi:uncharacterized protein CLUP02_16576 [Colletotrichum lupini]|uniref:Uncharacterized protein n=1 Tax=Colletotrichum lupini TaxID=145971 RepID=A0A9Q8WQ45_9PEZI|nr:uncharacterized protein CLUP02_16576 [Colletotrichum lupini]UQC91042.1 hypothetical protein CLUP02_16576 [Colletotrichum lupini]
MLIPFPVFGIASEQEATSSLAPWLLVWLSLRPPEARRESPDDADEASAVLVWDWPANCSLPPAAGMRGSGYARTMIRSTEYGRKTQLIRLCQGSFTTVTLSSREAIAMVSFVSPNQSFLPETSPPGLPSFAPLCLPNKRTWRRDSRVRRAVPTPANGFNSSSQDWLGSNIIYAAPSNMIGFTPSPLALDSPCLTETTSKCHTPRWIPRHVLPRGILLELGTTELAQDIGLVVSLAVSVRTTATSANSDKLLPPQGPYSRIISHISMFELEPKQKTCEAVELPQPCSIHPIWSPTKRDRLQRRATLGPQPLEDTDDAAIPTPWASHPLQSGRTSKLYPSRFKTLGKIPLRTDTNQISLIQRKHRTSLSFLAHIGVFNIFAPTLVRHFAVIPESSVTRHGTGGKTTQFHDPSICRKFVPNESELTIPGPETRNGICVNESICFFQKGTKSITWNMHLGLVFPGAEMSGTSGTAPSSQPSKHSSAHFHARPLHPAG